MATQKRNISSQRKQKIIRERDSTYLLKLILVVILGTVWLKFNDPIVIGGVPLIGIPLGAMAGILIVHLFEKIEQDRKIWYAILLVVMILTLFAPIGIIV